MSTLMFWNKQNANANQTNGGPDAKNGGKKEWLHSPDALVNGHVAYLVKVSNFGNRCMTLFSKYYNSPPLGGIYGTHCIGDGVHNGLFFKRSHGAVVTHLKGFIMNEKKNSLRGRVA